MPKDQSTMSEPVVHIEGLLHQYTGATSPALVFDHLELNRCEQVVMTGHSGCGKSTLLNLLAGLMHPTSGKIEILGIDLGSLSSSKLDIFRGQNIGMVFQTFQLLNGYSVLENVLAALMFSKIPRGAHRSRAISLLESLGIMTPHSKIEQLSIGQQQRVAVARAVACSPQLVLADEPTAALDPEYASRALDVLQEACRSIGATLICVTHDRSCADRFDRHIQLLSHEATNGLNDVSITEVV
jgi:ABC-type lipoprotein export system ATPase subunit